MYKLLFYILLVFSMTGRGFSQMNQDSTDTTLSAPNDSLAVTAQTADSTAIDSLDAKIQTADSTAMDSLDATIQIADTTAMDSLALAAADSVKLDSAEAAEPLYDFRTEPQQVMHGLYRDSTLIIGSRYTSFGDIFDWIPGGYYYNRGGAGQLSYGSMYGGPPGEMVLEYDGLNLNDPLTGLADFNLIPTESMGHAGIIHSSYRPYGYMPIGHSLSFESRTIADNPIRSQVGYRTGFYQYDDVDIRLGIKASQKFWLDFGGVIRNYGGLIYNEAYSGTKVNAKLNRRFGSDWLLRYVMLFSLRDTQIPLPGSLMDFPDFSYPKQKDGRIDHALILRHKSNLSATLQYTKFERELRAEKESVFKEQSETHTVQGTGELKIPIGLLQWRNGLHGWGTWADNSSWGKKADWQLDAYTSLLGGLGKRINWSISLKAEKNEDFNPELLPEVNLFFSFDSTARMSVWANRIVYYPSMAARYAVGPFAFGNSSLSNSIYDHAGLAVEKKFDNIFMHASLAFKHRDNQIATFFDGETVHYSNIPAFSTLSIDAQVDYSFLKKWRFVLKGNVFSDLGANPVVAQRPNLYAKTFLQYHLLAFKGDLNAQLRAGAFILGQRQGPVPFYADYTASTVTLDPAIYAYGHAVLHYGAADIFFAYENYNMDVQYVYGYSMPQMWFRYGFIWHFID